MGRIHVLDDHLINRIAAGEVVERPASVVKELIENSLDAGAQAIEVAIEAGGKRSIRVSDDGEGMERDDALLALERHATSKLSRVEDIDQIETLGFRGEALPSMAAVSRFVLRTAPRAGAGTEIEVRGGRIQAVRELGLPRGTWVRVERLFYNVPARRKFLRADATELSHVARLVTRNALANPSVRFRLDQEGRRLVEAPATENRGERIGQLYGSEFVAHLLPFGLERGGIRVRGFAGRPVDALPRREAQHLFVNGRIVHDRVLTHAVQEAYGNTMPRGRYPALILFVELEPRQLDVNVHPQKTEVRFRRSGEVHDTVRDAVSSALSQGRAVPAFSDLRPQTLPGAELAGAAAATARYLELHDNRGVRPEPQPTHSKSADPSPVSARTGEGLPKATLLQQRPGVEEGSQPVPLAQYRDSYIVAQDARGLLLVDQHAAHERILFERYLAEAEQNRVEVQRMMFPLTLELPPHERVLMEEEAEEFRRLGFAVEPFGGNTVRLDGVPSLAAELEPAKLLRELLGEASRTRSAAAGVDDLRRRLVTTAACKAAIKINHPLTLEGMRQLLDDLFQTVNPTTCPHGRPVLFRLTRDEIERAFRRR